VNASFPIFGLFDIDSTHHRGNSITLWLWD
jgi:hypothetical protein